MARSPKASVSASGATSKLHLGARIDDAVHEFRESIARRRGHTPTVIPYTGYGSPGWIRVLCRVLLTKPNPNAEKRYKKIRGWRSFTSVPVDDVVVTIEIAGVEQSVTAGRGGVVDTVVAVDLEPGWHTITIRTDGSEVVDAPIFVVDPAARFGLISDVDDTVMVTALPRPFLAFWNTFVLDEHARRPVPGMAVLYERLLRDHPGAPVFYLSTGAWNVAPTLTRFLMRHLYPSGPLLLTDWGPTHDRWFRSGRDHKRQSLARLAKEFPDLRWLLVGDDGQHDEELYSGFAATHESNVEAIAIRELSTSEAVFAGGRSKDEERAHDDSARWVFAPDGAGLAEQLVELGILEDSADHASGSPNGLPYSASGSQPQNSQEKPLIEPGIVVRHDFAIRTLKVARTHKLSPGLLRVTVTGDELAGFTSVGPTDHSKVFFPDPDTGAIAAPRVTAEGLQPPEAGTIIMRDYTPRAFREATEDQAPELDFDFVLHGDDGPAALWAASAAPGDTLVVGGPRGSRIPPSGATRFILAADESALPALARWIETLPEDVEILAYALLSNESDAAYLEPAHVHRAKVVWLRKEEGTLERAIRNLGPIGDGTFVWVAGEATSLIPIRRYLRRELGLPAAQVKIDGYWKQGEVGRDHHAPIDPADPED